MKYNDNLVIDKVNRNAVIDNLVAILNQYRSIPIPSMTLYYKMEVDNKEYEDHLRNVDNIQLISIFGANAYNGMSEEEKEGYLNLMRKNRVYEFRTSPWYSENGRSYVLWCTNNLWLTNVTYELVANIMSNTAHGSKFVKFILDSDEIDNYYRFCSEERNNKVDQELFGEKDNSEIK